LMVPWVVSAVKSGASSLMRSNDIVVELLRLSVQIQVPVPGCRTCNDKANS
jgi:hypothetical protein